MKILKINKKTNISKILYDDKPIKTNKDKFNLLISDEFKNYFPKWMIEYIDEYNLGEFDLSQVDEYGDYNNFFEYVEDEWMLDTLSIEDILKELETDKYKYIIS